MKCQECGKEIEGDLAAKQKCPNHKLLCDKCAWDCYENEVIATDEPEWDECDSCPYREDDIDYEKLERDYPYVMPELASKENKTIKPEGQ